VCAWPVPRRVEAPVVLEPERTGLLRAPGAGKIRAVYLESGRPAVPGTTALLLEPADPEPEPVGGRYPLFTEAGRPPQSALEPQIARAARRAARLHEDGGSLERAREADWLIDRWAAPLLSEASTAAASTVSDQHRALVEERRRRRVLVPPEPEGRAWVPAGRNPQALLDARVEDGAPLVELGTGLVAVLQVPAGRIALVREGMPVRFTLTRFGRTAFEGTVTKVAPTAGADGTFAVSAAVRTALRYVLDDGALAALAALRDESEASIPETVLHRLAELKDESYPDAGAFRERLRKVLPAGELESHGAVVIEYARRGPAEDSSPMVGMEGEAAVLIGRRPLILALAARWLGE
jgi:hypothetical protein